MHFDSGRAADSAQRQLQLTRRFAAGRVPGTQFETEFLRLRMQMGDRPTASVEDVLTQIFYAVDDFVADDSLRPKVRGGIDEEQLREIVRTQLRRLDEADAKGAAD